MFVSRLDLSARRRGGAARVQAHSGGARGGLTSSLVRGATVVWGPRRMPAIVLKVAGDQVELAYRRRRQLRTAFTAIERVEISENTNNRQRIAADVAPRLQLGLFD